MKIDKRTTRHQEKRDLVAKLFQDLGSTRLVADQLGMGVRTVGGILNRQGIATPRTGKIAPYSPCEMNGEKLLKMCEEGYSLTQMGKAIGAKKETVKKFLRRNGVTKEFLTTKEGEKHYAWKGRLIDKDGYVLIHTKGHPNARKHTPYIFEHRLVMEEFLGRFLAPNEVVHHINGLKDDNRIENLQLFENNAAHLAVDLKGRCPKWSEDGKERIQKALRQRWSDWRSANPKE